MCPPACCVCPRPAHARMHRGTLRLLRCGRREEAGVGLTDSWGAYRPHIAAPLTHPPPCLQVSLGGTAHVTNQCRENTKEWTEAGGDSQQTLFPFPSPSVETTREYNCGACLPAAMCVQHVRGCVCTAAVGGERLHRASWWPTVVACYGYHIFSRLLAAPASRTPRHTPSLTLCPPAPPCRHALLPGLVDHRLPGEIWPRFPLAFMTLRCRDESR